MNCTSCLDNCAGNIQPDKCVKYTGPNIDCLNICTGASLYQVIQALSTKACQNDIDSTALDIDSVCTFFSTIMGTNTNTTFNLLQALITGECQLKTAIDAINAQLNAPLTINTSCLGLSSNPTRDNILIAVVKLLCTVSSDLTAIQNDYVKATQLNSLIAQYLQSIGISTTGGGGIVQEYTKMPKYVALPYHGPLTVFDAAGNGLSAQGYDKVYICIGQTIRGVVLPDYRGRSPIGANSGVPQTDISSDVVPTGVNNYNISLNTKIGEYKHALTVSEEAPHSHTVTDTSLVISPNSRGANGAQSGGDWTVASTPLSTTVTTSTTGTGYPHNTTHPVIGTVMIMYIP